ncbi:MAG TPA: hypothetical protein VLS89_20970 [Candidatus Nanopelagicales bacterium]|nr:hypothetical protein [Candidatus Nanopelagicales bacterium]
MSGSVTLKPVSSAPIEDAVVTMMKGAVGAHVGLLYRADHEGTRRHLHLADHFSLRDDLTAPSDAFWVVPGLDEFALADVRASARLIARRHEDGRVPYAFRQADARFDETGTLRLNQSLGLTCSTFVRLVFARAGVELVDAETWDLGRSAERRREDEAAQSRLVSYLRRRPDAQQHAERVEQEIGCTRIRAEETAVASGMKGHPISFARAEPQGRHVLGVVLGQIASGLSRSTPEGHEEHEVSPPA